MIGLNTLILPKIEKTSDEREVSGAKASLFLGSLALREKMNKSKE